MDRILFVAGAVVAAFAFVFASAASAVAAVVLFIFGAVARGLR